MPYYLSNVHDLYKNGHTLNDVLFSDYFASIRKWQNDYGYAQPAQKVNNFIVPCIIRDHFPATLDIVTKFGAKPLDENAHQALEDTDYHKRMTEYGQSVKEITEPLWLKEFMGQGKSGK